MSLDLSQAEQDVLDSDTQRIGVLFRIDTEPACRFWLGIGDIKPGINAYDAASETYTGLGSLLDVPALQQLLNGVAERVVFRVEGVSAKTSALASNSSNDVKGCAVVLGISIFGGDWSQLGIPKWLWRGSADFVTLSQSSDGKQTTRVIELSCGSLFTGRRRRAFSYLTDEDQQGRSPGDEFCERTVLYSNDITKVWPTF